MFVIWNASVTTANLTLMSQYHSDYFRRTHQLVKQTQNAPLHTLHMCLCYVINIMLHADLLIVQRYCCQLFIFSQTSGDVKSGLLDLAYTEQV